jgi:uncharacterized XkdX family phage protein
MNWLQIAERDWATYHDTARISSFVEKGKITAEQYQEITGEAYVA